MLIRNFMNQLNFADNTNITAGVGTVVGINIKKCHLHYPYDKELESYGIFLHVKVEDPFPVAQYDLVFDTFTSDIFHPSRLLSDTDSFSKSRKVETRADIKSKRIKILWKRTKHKKKNGISTQFCRTTCIETSPIVEILDVCGANEWVEIIGSKIRLSVITPINFNDTYPMFMFVSTPCEPHELPKHIVVPNMFQVHTDDETLNIYMDLYQQANPDMLVDEYDRSLYTKRD